MGTTQKLKPAKIPRHWGLFLIIIILMGEAALTQPLLLWYAQDDLILLDPPRKEGQQGAPTEHPSTTCLPPRCSPTCEEQCSAQPGAVGLFVSWVWLGFPLAFSLETSISAEGEKKKETLRFWSTGTWKEANQGSDARAAHLLKINW